MSPTCLNDAKTCADVHDPHMMNPGHFNEPLNFNLFAATVFSVKSLDNY